MFFLLKCGVWLAIVYAAIIYGIGPLGRFANGDTSRQIASDAARVGQAAVGGAVSNMIGVGEAGSCLHRRSDCLADAARLTALLETSLKTDPSGAPVRQSAPPVLSPPPMPVRDPRRHAGALRLPSKS